MGRKKAHVSANYTYQPVEEKYERRFESKVKARKKPLVLQPFMGSESDGYRGLNRHYHEIAGHSIEFWIEWRFLRRFLSFVVSLYRQGLRGRLVQGFDLEHKEGASSSTSAGSKF